MSFEKDQIDELKKINSSVFSVIDNDVEYLLIEGLQLPEGCSPNKVDVLICPTPRDQYPSRLFLSEIVTCSKKPNWNKTDRIVERNWFAYSFRVPVGLRLAQLLASHLKGLQ